MIEQVLMAAFWPAKALGAWLIAAGDLLGLAGLPLVMIGVTLRLPYDMISGDINDLRIHNEQE